MFLINSAPANSILTPIVTLMKESSPLEIESFVLDHYDEEWFSTKTSSLKGNDNRLAHRIRTIRAQLGYTI